MGSPPDSGRAGLGGLGHLLKRFFDSIRAAPPDPTQEHRLRALLSDAEATLYEAMNGSDRRHAVRSAAFVMQAGADPEVAVASALHDVGKTAAALGTPGRVTASLVTLVLGRRRTIELSDRGGVLGRIGAYADHPRRGAEMLARANASALAEQWAREHHAPRAQSNMCQATAKLLWEADRA